MATLNIKNFPDSLYGSLKQQAGRNRRSIAQEVLHLLDAAMAEKPRLSLLALEGLGRDVWLKSLEGKDASDYIAEERDSWS